MPLPAFPVSLLRFPTGDAPTPMGGALEEPMLLASQGSTIGLVRVVLEEGRLISDAAILLLPPVQSSCGARQVGLPETPSDFAIVGALLRSGGGFAGSFPALLFIAGAASSFLGALRIASQIAGIMPGGGFA